MMKDFVEDGKPLMHVSQPVGKEPSNDLVTQAPCPRAGSVCGGVPHRVPETLTGRLDLSFPRSLTLHSPLYTR